MPSLSLQFTADTSADLTEQVDGWLAAMRSKEQQEAAEQLAQMTAVTVSTSRKHKPWTEFEMNFLRENYQVKSAPWIAKALHRPNQSIAQMLHKMYQRGPAAQAAAQWAGARRAELRAVPNSVR